VVGLVVGCSDAATGPGGFPGTANGAVSVVATAGTGQRTPSGTAVPDRPAVLVRDADGNPVPNVTVTFAVTSGGGTVTGATQVTNAAGAATVGSWTLGATGMNILTATVTGLEPAMFVAEALEACLAGVSYTLGTVVDGALRDGDCRPYNEAWADFYVLDSADYRVLTIEQASDSVDSYLTLRNRMGFEVAFNDDGSGGFGRDASIVAFVAPGRYVIGASSFSSGDVGPYRLTTAAPSTVDVTNCAGVFLTPDVSVAQRVQTTDCVIHVTDPNTGAVSTYYADSYLVWLPANRTFTIDMTDPTLDTYLELRDLSDYLHASNDDAAGTTNARITVRPPFGRYYVIVAGTSAPRATGTYTLSIR